MLGLDRAKVMSCKAAGLDGWAPGELHGLGSHAVAALGRLLRRCEDAGAWPSQLYECWVSLIPKHDSVATTAESLRPITLCRRCSVAGVSFGLGSWKTG